MPTAAHPGSMRRANILATLILYPSTADQLRSRFPQHRDTLADQLSGLAADGLIHSVRTAQAETWHPGPRP